MLKSYYSITIPPLRPPNRMLILDENWKGKVFRPTSTNSVFAGSGTRPAALCGSDLVPEREPNNSGTRIFKISTSDPLESEQKKIQCTIVVV